MAIKNTYFDTQYIKDTKDIGNDSQRHAQTIVTNYELFGALTKEERKGISRYNFEDRTINACTSEDLYENNQKHAINKIYGSDAVDSINTSFMHAGLSLTHKLVTYYKPRKGGYQGSYAYGVNTRRGAYIHRHYTYRYKFHDNETLQRLMLNEYGLSLANSYNGRYVINKDIAITLRTDFTEFTELNVSPLTFGIKTLKFYAST